MKGTDPIVVVTTLDTSKMTKTKSNQPQQQHQNNGAFDPFHIFGNQPGGGGDNSWSTRNSNVTQFDENLVKADDVSVDAVVTSLYLNSIIFVVLMLMYEGIRRLFPPVYSRRKRIQYKNGGGRFGNTSSSSSSFLMDDDEKQDGAPLPQETMTTTSGNNNGGGGGGLPRDSPSRFSVDESHLEKPSSLTLLPDENLLDWIIPVMSVSWKQVQETAGLDGYFFLRYIRMNIRITLVSSFWFFLILVPLYATGHNPSHSPRGWYHLSAANLSTEDWRMWVAVFMWYLFSAFIVFVIEQEYRHFLALRQSFLAKGCENVNPQHHYSIKVESVPRELRSDRALKEYFEKLFPGLVHSSSVLLAAGDLQEVSIRCKESCHRLEKSIAHLHANETRPSHIVGHGCQEMMSGVLSSMGCSDKTGCCCGICCHYPTETVPAMSDADMRTENPPPKGARVDSISYYTWDLAQKSRQLFHIQRQKSVIAKLGNDSIRGENWLDQIGRNVESVAFDVMGDSIDDNNLYPPSKSFVSERSPPPTHRSFFSPVSLKKPHGQAASLIKSDYGSIAATQTGNRSEMAQEDVVTPSAKKTCCSVSRRWTARLGLDFAVFALRYMNGAVDATFEGVLGTTMSSTGFVTFLDLSSTTVAASAPLTVKSHSLKVSIAPEPREILWQNAHIAQTTQLRREIQVNIVLFLGAVLWSFPLTAIQVFFKAEYIAQIPGMEWIVSFNGGALESFVNGYLPVVALLGLICVLPIIFEQLAVYYERRKTISDVQSSMCKRYFYYQLANIYITVTAGSLLHSLADILDHPSNILELLGKSLPYMVGYFVALLVTKILAGLPMVLLRFGALARMMILRTFLSEKNLTQRELDSVYRLENMQYGWEFPTQLLVVVIVFTYAVICPIILPFGLVFFLVALVVYKKQILYVYSPIYESGGAIFPLVLQHTLFGLVCGQMTFLGYVWTRGCYYEPIALLPLPIMTVLVMWQFQETFADPSTLLSLELARDYDRKSNLQACKEEQGILLLEEGVETSECGIESRRISFDKKSYRQPVLTELPSQPWRYRRGQEDEETMTVRNRLHQINRFTIGMSREEEDGNDTMRMDLQDMMGSNRRLVE